ncbi:MAG: HEPN domain-containing protein [Megasphaera sp.]|nr:HEPN domain-containing protein [Megasphaera sp.]MCH4188487.1 HEPN domain-containing protein [Megasphaera sp.]MCH4218429.1 HEPN domain-containing protein [Megasphaera sp.]
MPDNRKTLMQYRLDNAQEKIRAAALLYEQGSYKDSINRSYYAMFAAMRAILALDGVDFSKHAGVISYFQREYIKTGIFDKKYSKFISTAFQIRNNCDYADFFIVNKDDAKEQLDHAKEFFNVLQSYVSSNGHAK